LVDSYVFMITPREFHLAQRARLAHPVGSWVAVEPNGTGLPSRVNPPRLGAVLPSPRRAVLSNSSHTSALINFFSNHKICHSPELIEVWSGLLSAPNNIGGAQMEVLRALAEKPKTAQELASELGRSVETVKKVLKKMYRRGLVGRRREGRRSVYTLTDLGSLFLGVAEALRGGG